jgi:hypothetical protein
MKCYFHSESNAVSSCLKCNKSLCKDCYDQGDSGICSNCLINEQKKEKTIKSQNHLSYIKKSLLFFLLGLIIGWVITSPALTNSNINKSFLLIFLFLYGYVSFSIYWGLHILSSITQKLFSSGFLLIFTWPLFFILITLAGIIGMYVSVPMFIKHYAGYRKFNLENER